MENYRRLKCNILKGQIWLAKVWKDFYEYYSIRCGHFLMFGCNAHSHIDETIFELSAAEKVT